MLEQRNVPLQAADGELTMYSATLAYTNALDADQVIVVRAESNTAEDSTAVLTPSAHAELQLLTQVLPPNPFDPKNAPETDECCASANPLVPKNIALIVLILNIGTPGVGSIVAAYFDPKGCNCKCATFGILQLLLAIIIVGFVWSIYQGV